MALPLFTKHATAIILIDKIDNNIEDFNNKKAVELLDKHSSQFEKISGLFRK